MVISGLVLFLVVAVAANVADRRHHAGVAICLFIASGVVLGSTTVGPTVLKFTSGGVNGIANAGLSFFQSF